MKKPILTTALAMLVMLAGCGAKKQIPADPVTSLPDNAAEATVAAEETQAARPIADRVKAMQSSGEVRVFDEQNVLTEEERGQFDTYLGWVSDIRQICAAAVITDQLGGVSPEQFAQNYYRTLFGEGTSGYLVLVNNDTGEDQVYCEGVCETYIAGAPLQIAQATPLLVEGDYAGALELLLPAGELVPDRVLDRAGVLTAEETAALTERANPLEQRDCVLFLRETEDTAETTEATEATADAASETTADSTEASDTAAAETAAPSETAASAESTEQTEETAAAAPSEVPEAFKTRAEELRVKNEAEQLLVVDVTHGYAWIAGGDAAVSVMVQDALRKDGAFAAAQLYYDVVAAA